MEAFINEISLEGQYFSLAELESGINKLRRILSELIKLEKALVLSDIGRVRTFAAIRDEFFENSINQIEEKSVVRAFKNIYYNKKNVKNWRKSRVSDENKDFYWQEGGNENVNDTSVAEITERKLQVDFKPYLLINFFKSRFTNHLSINIKKDGEKDFVAIHCCDDKSSLDNWFANNYRKYVFDYQSNIAPSEDQTILRDHKRFKRLKSKKRPGGRCIYREKKTGNVWYVDSNHKGTSSHLEVFNRTGKRHIGKADLEGNIISNSTDPTRKIDLK